MSPQRHRTLSLSIPLALIMLAAHLLPVDAADRFSFLGRIADSYGGWFPYMGEYAAASCRDRISKAVAP